VKFDEIGFQAIALLIDCPDWLIELWNISGWKEPLLRYKVTKNRIPCSIEMIFDYNASK